MPTVEKLSPAQEALLTYWLRHSDGQSHPLPTTGDIELDEVGHHKDWAVIFEKMCNPLDYKYRLIGRNISFFIHHDYTGVRLSAMPGKGKDSKIWAFLTATVNAQKPLLEVLPYVGPEPDYSHTTLLSLPLTQQDSGAEMILLGVDFVKWPFIGANNSFDSKIASLKKFLVHQIKQHPI
tara:strand:+ start:76 stop:612 length:537 start_codon:yes stop_codon:yes gene_type:complete